jgi:hypothetical protein
LILRIPQPCPATAHYTFPPTSPRTDRRRDRKLRKEARDEIDRLIGFLGKTNDYVSGELEDSIDDNPHDDDELDGPEHAADEQDEPDEPSLGAFEGHEDQSVSWSGNGSDRELDGAESGIGDRDGLLEQVGTQDWQGGGMA